MEIVKFLTLVKVFAHLPPSERSENDALASGFMGGPRKRVYRTNVILKLFFILRHLSTHTQSRKSEGTYQCFFDVFFVLRPLCANIEKSPP